MTLPEVSVVLPTYNRAAYLREAVDSVSAQTYRDWELVIADDGSDDSTRAFLSRLEDPRTIVLFLAHSGNPGAVRNRAIERARGKYVAFLDSDDVWAPRKLEIQLELMRSRPERRWSYSNTTEIDEKSNPLPAGAEPSLYDGWIVEPLLTLRASIATPSVVVERSLLDEVGPFDEAQHFGEDYDLWVRLALRSEVSVVSEPLAHVRNRHFDRYSIDRLAEFVAWVRLYGKMAGIMPDSRLRSLCMRRRAEQALVLAGQYVDRGDHAAVARTLIASSTYSWRYLDWWWGAAKTIVRPVAPSPLRSLYRRWRG